MILVDLCVLCLAPLFALGFDFFFCSIMDPNFIGCPRCVSGTSLAPVVTAGIGKELPLRIEGCTRNASLNRIKSLEPLLVVYKNKDKRNVM